MKIILPIIIIALALLAMAVGAFYNRRPLQGSCGGQNGKITIGGVQVTCPACGGDVNKCEQETGKLTPGSSRPETS